MEANNEKFEEYWEALEQSVETRPDEDFLKNLEALSLNSRVSKFLSVRNLVGIAASLIFLISINLFVLNSVNADSADSIHAEYEDEYSLIPNPFI